MPVKTRCFRGKKKGTKRHFKQRRTLRRRGGAEIKNNKNSRVVVIPGAVIPGKTFNEHVERGTLFNSTNPLD